MLDQISCPEARELINQGGQLIDVRGPDEFSRGALPGAVNIPVQMLSNASGQLAADKPVVLYCASGARSAQACMMLQQMGFNEVYNLGSFQKYYTC
jgi:rhodanese-related sulfurtransferase